MKDSNKARRLLKKLTLVTVLGVLICGSMFGCGSDSATINTTSNTANDADAEEPKTYLLGTDKSIKDLSNDNKGECFEFVATFQIKTAKKTYFFDYYEVGSENDFPVHVRDSSSDNLLSKLDDYTYEDEINCKLIGTLESIDYSSQDPHYYFAVTNMEIVEKNEAKDIVLDDRYYVGDTIQFISGVEIHITDAGYLIDRTGRKYAYIQVEYINNSEEAQSFGSASVLFYGDDYLISEDSSYPDRDDVIGYETVHSGRRMNGICVTRCEAYDDYDVIECQIGDAVIVVKDISAMFSTANIGDSPMDCSAYMGYYEGEYYGLAFSPYTADIDSNEVASVEIYYFATGEQFYYSVEIETGSTDWDNWGYDYLLKYTDKDGYTSYLGLYTDSGVKYIDMNSETRNNDILEFIYGFDNAG